MRHELSAAFELEGHAARAALRDMAARIVEKAFPSPLQAKESARGLFVVLHRQLEHNTQLACAFLQHLLRTGGALSHVREATIELIPRTIFLLVQAKIRRITEQEGATGQFRCLEALLVGIYGWLRGEERTTEGQAVVIERLLWEYCCGQGCDQHSSDSLDGLAVLAVQFCRDELSLTQAAIHSLLLGLQVVLLTRADMHAEDVVFPLQDKLLRDADPALIELGLALVALL